MRSKAILMLGLAVVFAAVAVILLQNWIDKRSAAVAEQNKLPTATVVIAKTPLNFGAIVRKEHLAVIEWPANTVPAGSFSKTEELVNDEAKEPRVVLRRIEANEPVMESKVSGFGGRASLSAVISGEMRASTIRVNDVNGVAGFVLPGDRVDILLTRDRQTRKTTQNSSDLITDVLLQNVKVLAIDQDANQDKETPSIAKAVTVEVTSHQAQKLVLAQKVGSLSLALRNMTNADPEPARTVSISDLKVGEVNEPKPEPVVKKKVIVKKAVEKPVDSLSSVKIVRGTKQSEYRVQQEESAIGPAIRYLPRDLRPPRAEEPEAAVEEDDGPTAQAPGTAPSLSQREPTRSDGDSRPRSLLPGLKIRYALDELDNGEN